MMIVARLIKSRELRVQLTWPTFDNLHALLVGEGVEVIRAAGLSTEDRRPKDDYGVVVEVTPNNPTGSFLDAEGLRRLAVSCKRAGRLLVLDQSFKAQLQECAAFDHYPILEETGVSYIVIEDSGKLWPTLDLKVAFLICSPDLQIPIEDIADDVLLNVSPFALELVRQYAAFSTADHWQSVRGVIEKNREYLRAALRDSGLEATPAYPRSGVSVEVVQLWDSIPQSWHTFLRNSGVSVLDAGKFYWGSSERPAGTQMRVSLARDSEYFAGATKALVAGLGRLRGQSR